jgi:hypothetical protein
VRKRQLQFVGRIVRLADDNLLRGLLHAELWFGSRLSGRPETAFRHSLLTALESFHIPVEASTRSVTVDEVDSWAAVDELGPSPPHGGWLERAKDSREWDKVVRAGADLALEEWTARRVLRSKKAAERGVASREEDDSVVGVVVDVTPSRSWPRNRRRVAPERHTSVLRAGVTRYPIGEQLLREPWRVASRRGRGEWRRECYVENMQASRLPLSWIQRWLIRAKSPNSN